jgi:hypothetical protein
MRYLLLSPLLLLAGCYPYYGYGYGYGYPGYGYGYHPYYAPYGGPVPYQARQPYYGGAPPAYGGTAPAYGSVTSSYGSPAAYDPANCGTPDQPKACNR